MSRRAPVRGPNWTPAKPRRLARRPRTIHLPVRLDPEHLFRLAVTEKFKATLALLDEYDRTRLMIAVVKCSREQRIGYLRALTIYEDTETGGLVLASRWPCRRWVGPTLEPIDWHLISWHPRELVSA